MPPLAKQDQHTLLDFPGTYTCVLEKFSLLEVPKFAKVSGLMGSDLLTT